MRAHMRLQRIKGTQKNGNMDNVIFQSWDLRECIGVGLF